jgi:hypothetical protein
VKIVSLNLRSEGIGLDYFASSMIYLKLEEAVGGLLALGG